MSERSNKAAKNLNLVDLAAGAEDGPDFARAASSVVNGWAEFGGQLLSYAQSSLQTGLDAAEALRQCGSPKDVAEVQMRYARRAYDGYLEELQRIGGLWTRVSTEAVEALGVRR